MSNVQLLCCGCAFIAKALEEMSNEDDYTTDETMGLWTPTNWSIKINFGACMTVEKQQELLYTSIRDLAT